MTEIKYINSEIAFQKRQEKLLSEGMAELKNKSLIEILSKKYNIIKTSLKLLALSPKEEVYEIKAFIQETLGGEKTPDLPLELLLDETQQSEKYKIQSPTLTIKNTIGLAQTYLILSEIGKEKAITYKNKDKICYEWLMNEADINKIRAYKLHELNVARKFEKKQLEENLDSALQKIYDSYDFKIAI